MDTRLALFLASLLGFIPSYGLLFLSISGLERKLDEKDTMITFVIGLFAGTVVVVAHLLFLSEYRTSGLSLISAILLALAESMLIFVFLNRKKFKGRKDLLFIGYSFGLGISGIYILYLAGRMFFFLDMRPTIVLGMIAYAIAVPLMRGSAGLVIAERKLKERPYIGVALGTVLLGVFNILSFLYLYSFYLWTFGAAALIMGAVAFHFNARKLRSSPDLNR